MSPIKQEPIDNSPEVMPDIKSETIDYPPHIKSETIEYSPPSKRLKTLSSDSPSTSSKGKSKIENEDDNEDDELQLGTCGVCLLDEGVSLRGFIDSCDHYFCFVCIMEWAKIESRCPICKRRFSTIHRPKKDGVFLSERIVNVPVRDQIYNHGGNATIGPPDPYSQVKCSVCCGSSDEQLLLLCDLCDSAAHSYCVGLGATVPEGDWFCKDCTLSRDEHAKVETNTTSDDDNKPRLSSNTKQVTSPEVSIHDIVRDSSEQRLKPQSTVDGSNAPNARTLQRCLNVHSRIRVLRENWEGLRGGSVNFSSSSENRVTTSQNQSTPAKHESTSQNHPYDINKAWKMMDIAAKALGKKTGNKNSVPKGSELHKKKEKLMKEASKVRPDSNYFVGLKKNERLLNEASTVRPDSNYFGGLKKNERLLNDANKVRPESNYFVGSKKNERLMNEANKVRPDSNHFVGLKKNERLLNDANKVRPDSSYSGGLKKNESGISSSTKIIASAELKNDGYNCRNLSTASNGVGSSGQSSSVATDKRCAKKMTDATLEKKKNIKKETPLDGNIKETENAKSEIQSLVKLNLKLLSKDKKLGVDAFKEVARHATHSIMAACGIEPPKARFRSFERVTCDHGQTRKRPSSTLMPTSCRECFFVFVKDVVTAIAFDATTS
ncbi:putative chromatin regulator PHD family [Helianthus annuus]|nr:putative chromatin regulator PHD family [Helianthus annuus]